MPSSVQLHASCVSVDGRGVLITGVSGGGKSDLCLRLIDAGAVLVADDRVIVESLSESVLSACAPERLRGLLEVRGVGVMTVPYQDSVPLVLVVEAVATSERLPDALSIEIAGVSLPLLQLNLLHASAPAKLRLALSGQPL